MPTYYISYHCLGDKYACSTKLTLSEHMFQIPGLVVEPVIFTAIMYWLAGLQETLYAFCMTAGVVILCINVASACGEC